MTMQTDFPRSTFAEAATHMPGPVFAAVDGAQFDDAPALLNDAGLSWRSLFLDADPETEAAGPIFVDLTADDAREKLVALIGEKPAAVLWSCPSGETALYRHLRGLNLAVIPQLREDAPARPEGEARPAEDYRDENVFFRHYDPCVMARVLPVLDEHQFMRMLGPASLALFATDERVKPYLAPALDYSVIVPNGPLRLRPEQMEAIDNAHIERSRRKIAGFLREVAARALSPTATDAQLAAYVRESEAEARTFGITSECGRGQWAFLSLITKGQLREYPQVQSLFCTSGASPNETMDQLFHTVARGASNLKAH